MTTVPAPPNISYGKVVWQVISDVTDGSDPDANPDFIAPTGTVTFVASISTARDNTATPNPVSIVRDPIVGILDADGYLCTPDATDPTIAGARGVLLIATDDEDLNPVDWTYNVSYQLKGNNGRSLSLKSHQIYVPTYDSETDNAVDLTTVGPVDNATAIGTAQAEALAAQAAASAQIAADALVDSESFVADQVGSGPAAGVLDGRYVPQPDSGVPGKDVQFEGVRTISDDGTNIGLVKTAVGGDMGTRFYIMPTDVVTTGVGGTIKIFGDPFWRDPTHAESYRDCGMYFSADQDGGGTTAPDTGMQGTGVFWINSKVGGTDGNYAGKNPDIGFSFQDGQFVAGRFVYLPASVFGGTSRALFVVGKSKPDNASATTVRMEVQGDIGFDKNAGAGGRAIRWWSGGGSPALNNLVQFNTADMTAKIAGVQALKLLPAGGVVLGNAVEQATTATTGHLQIPTVNGLPTGNFTAEAGHVGLVYDRVNHKLCVKVPGEVPWRVGGVFA